MSQEFRDAVDDALPLAPYKISRQKSSSTPAQRNLIRQTSADTGAELDDEDKSDYDPIDFGNADPNIYPNIDLALVSTLANDPLIADMV